MSTATNLARATSAISASKPRLRIVAQNKEAFFKKPNGEIAYVREVDRRKEYKRAHFAYADEQDAYNETYSAYEAELAKWEASYQKKFELYQRAEADWFQIPYNERYKKDDEGNELFPRPKRPERTDRPSPPPAPEDPDNKWRKVVLYLSLKEKKVVYLDADGNMIVNQFDGWKEMEASDVLLALSTVINNSDQHSTMYVPSSGEDAMAWVNIDIPDDEKANYPRDGMDYDRQNNRYRPEYRGYGKVGYITDFVDEITREADKMWNDPLSFTYSRRYTLGRILGDRISFPFLARVYADKYEELSDNQAQRKSELLGTTPDECPEIPNLKKGVEYYPHQALSLAVLDKTNTAVLDISMGGGKTLILLSDALNMLLSGKCKRPLFVMPNSTLGQQKAEIEEFTNNRVNVCIVNSDTFRAAGKNEEERQIWFEEFAGEAPVNTLYLTSYAFIRKKLTIKTGEQKMVRGRLKDVTEDVCPNAQWLMDGLKIDYVALDESHRIKNTGSVTYKAAMTLSEAPIRRIASGTVIPNSPTDLLAQTRFLDPNILGSEREFIREYAEQVDGYGKVRQWRPGALKEIRNKLLEAGGVSIRRSHWMHLLPERTERIHQVKMSKAQQKVYNQLLNSVLEEIQKDKALAAALKKVQESGEELTEYPQLLAKLSKLDTYICAPDTSTLIQHAPVEEHLSPKVPRINRILREHFAMEDPGKVLVFVKNKASARHIVENLDPEFRSQALYYAATDGAEIKNNVNRFKHEDEIQILVGVDQSLREGQNLQVANRIIRADLHWNPGDMEQSYARAWRPKQARACYIDIVICDNSIEVPKFARAVSKMHIQRKVDSNFEDEDELEVISMNMYTINTMTQFSELAPYIERMQAIKEAEILESKAITEKYGFEMVPRRMNGVIAGSATVPTPIMPRTNIEAPVYKIYVDKSKFRNKKVLMVADEESIDLFDDRAAKVLGFKWSDKLEGGAWWIPYPTTIKKFKDEVLSEGYKMAWSSKRKMPTEIDISAIEEEVIDFDISVYDLMQKDWDEYTERMHKEQLEERKERAKIDLKVAAIRITYATNVPLGGTWGEGYEHASLWVSGTTYPVRDILKGFKTTPLGKKLKMTFGFNENSKDWTARLNSKKMLRDPESALDALERAAKFLQKEIISSFPELTVVIAKSSFNDPVATQQAGFAPLRRIEDPDEDSILKAMRIVDGNFTLVDAEADTKEVATLVARRALLMWTLDRTRSYRGWYSTSGSLGDSWYELAIDQMYFEGILEQVAKNPEAAIADGEGAADSSEDDDSLPGTSVKKGPKKKGKKGPKKKKKKTAKRKPIWGVIEERDDLLYFTFEEQDEGADLVKSSAIFKRRPGFATFTVDHRRDAMRMVERVKKKGLDISNEQSLVADIKRTQRLKGRKKDVVYAPMRRETKPDFEVEMLFGTVNGEPTLYVWLTEAAAELAKLKALGWTATFPFYEAWIKDASLSNFVRIMKKLDAAGVYFENFEEFAGAVQYEWDVDITEDYSHMASE